MRRCPICGRTYSKDTQKFCTVDGGALVAAAIDPNPTIRDAPDQSAMDAPTRAISQDLVPPSSAPLDPYKTMVGVRPPTDERRQADTGPGSQTISAPLPPATSAPLPPPAPPPGVHPTFVQPPPARKKSKMPLILGLLAVLLFVGLAGFAAGYFFVLRPLLEAKNRADRGGPEAANQNLNANVELQTPVENDNAGSKTATEPAFVPPAGTVEFVNSKDNLDGKLAEHYSDFSFYYPESWARDPQAGVPGANNFVKVERRLPPDFTQENFAVGWYASRGSFAADRQLFPSLVEALSANLEKGFPEYQKLSEGDTKVNSYDAYEFRFQSVSRNTRKGDITLWGRVVFLPPNTGANGATLLMLATSLAPELTSADDLGTEGQMPVILESFRLGTKR
ncbi:MAG: hypothetical protein ABJC05_02950 [Pyrinomonadaceae bacterium]